MALHRSLLLSITTLTLTIGASHALADKPDVVKLDEGQIPKVEFPEKAVHDQTPLRVKVLVYEFNPWIPGDVHSPDKPGAKPKRLREVCGWNNPRDLARGYMEDMLEASGGYIQFEIVEWNIVDQFQTKIDGFAYTPESYMKCFRKEAEWHQPDGTDYAMSIKELGMAKRIDAGEADEIWWFGAPYMGWYESLMVGPKSFWINGPAMTDYPCKRRFAIMGYNYERGVAEVIHDLGHRTESSMAYYYGGWKVDELTTNWARFAANEHQSGTAAVGTCHYPANAEHDYDYANERTVMSTADDWLNYPDLTGEKKRINREAWGGPDYHRNYQCWFFTRLPKAPGVNPDGRENNWWKYIFNFNAYLDDRSGAPDPDAKPVRDRAVEQAGATRPA